MVVHTKLTPYHDTYAVATYRLRLRHALRKDCKAENTRPYCQPISAIDTIGIGRLFRRILTLHASEMSSLPNWVSNPSESHGPLMSIGAWSMLGVSTVFLFVRLYIRQSQGKLWLDDLALGISWVCKRRSFTATVQWLTYCRYSS